MAQKALILGLVTLAALGARIFRAETAEPNHSPGKYTGQDKSGFAVVELFTSQGCSSCPSADRNLAKIARWAKENQHPVYVLSYHVDYWNRLGWTDPYSSRANSERQRDYARTFQAERIYTPQMIVNGQREFVGSRGSLAEAAINEALAKKSVLKLDFLISEPEISQPLEVHFRTDAAPEIYELSFALVQPTVENSVPAGENRGLTLEHVNVVREFDSGKLAPTSGSRKLPFVYNDKQAAWKLIGMIQDPRTKEILAIHSEPLRQ